jgi:hypothetical protein
MSAVTVSAARDTSVAAAGDGAARAERLRHAIEHAGHLLPAQGPITVFIHHNTLHAFEELPFDEAVKEGAKVFGCNPYLPEDRYRDALARGRIRDADLEAVLRDDLGGRRDDRIGSICSRFELRLAMLRHLVRTGPATELRWYVAETDALARFRPEAPPAIRERLIGDTRRWVMHDVGGGARTGDGLGGTHETDLQEKVADLFRHFGDPARERWDNAAWEEFTLRVLWRVCRDGVHGLKTPVVHAPVAVRHRDRVLEATGCDSDLLVNGLLIRFCAAFLDQGLAGWTLPDRDRGFFHAFCSLYRQPGGPPDLWLRDLAAELARLQDSGVSPLESIAESLERLGVAETEWEDYISATFLALRGWGGMIQETELRGDRVAYPSPPGSLVGFLAVRLLLEQRALAHVARETLGFHGALNELRAAVQGMITSHTRPGVEQRAFQMFQLAQLLGWSPRDLHGLTKRDWSELAAEIEDFSNIERRRIFHGAYERRYREQVLDGLSVYARRGPRPMPSPRFQVVCCLDEREESFRRHLEEVAPNAETFGTAGFYAVAMYYRGAADAHFVPLCPVVIKPQHWVEEQVVDGLDEEHRRKATIRRTLGTAFHRIHVGSRTFVLGAALAAGMGVLAAIPLVGRVLFPRRAARVRRQLEQLVRTPPTTRLRLERVEPTPGPEPGRLGFSLEEMTNSAERVLRDIGLTSGFARLVVLLGHGSHSMNNPHESAHDCGACGGAVGGPNGRAIAQILNDPRVRERLAGRGLPIPAETVFVGGLHNTCNEYVKFADTDLVPESHRRELDEIHDLIELTLERNAHERARRFESAPLGISFADARRHMDARAEDLAQVRPEWGHATNSVCIVGRRSRTRGLFLDRRAFLTSYDPTQDDADAAILTRTLQAVIPVCGGISLEYYFSHIDPTGWGCGTKLPHNITSLLGVMDGAASDLRTGLPWQMVEIHEPVRILFVIETQPEILLRIMDRHEAIGRICRNDWVQVATLDPESPAIHLLRGGEFVPYRPTADDLPKARSSVDWYRGWRDHLDYAEIEPEPASARA